MTGCPDATRLQRLLEGDLSSAEAADFGAHAAGCRVCAARIARFRRVVAALEALPLHDPGPRLTDRVLARVVPSLVRQRWARRLGVGYAAVLAASAFAVVAWAVLPGSRLALQGLSAEVSRQLALTFVFLLHWLAAAVLSVAGVWGLARSIGDVLAPLARTFLVVFSSPAILTMLAAAAAASALVLWWMRSREARGPEVQHVDILGF